MLFVKKILLFFLLLTYCFSCCVYSQNSLQKKASQKPIVLEQFFFTDVVSRSLAAESYFHDNSQGSLSEHNIALVEKFKKSSIRKSKDSKRFKAVIDKYLESVEEYVYFFKQCDYPARYIYVRQRDEYSSYFLPDLHGRADFFYEFLKEEKILARLEKQEKIMISIGGDFSDLGNEIVLLVTTLFRLAVKYPKSFILIRGNHETRDQNLFAGTFTVLYKKFSEKAYELQSKLEESYSYLPLYCVIKVVDDECKIIREFWDVHGFPIIDKCDFKHKMERCPEKILQGCLRNMEGNACKLLWQRKSDFEDPVENCACKDLSGYFNAIIQNSGKPEIIISTGHDHENKRFGNVYFVNSSGCFSRYGWKSCFLRRDLSTGTGSFEEIKYEDNFENPLLHIRDLTAIEDTLSIYYKKKKFSYDSFMEKIEVMNKKEQEKFAESLLNNLNDYFESMKFLYKKEDKYSDRYADLDGYTYERIVKEIGKLAMVLLAYKTKHTISKSIKDELKLLGCELLDSDSTLSYSEEEEWCRYEMFLEIDECLNEESDINSILDKLRALQEKYGNQEEIEEIIDLQNFYTQKLKDNEMEEEDSGLSSYASQEEETDSENISSNDDTEKDRDAKERELEEEEVEEEGEDEDDRDDKNDDVYTDRRVVRRQRSTSIVKKKYKLGIISKIWFVFWEKIRKTKKKNLQIYPELDNMGNEVESVKGAIYSDIGSTETVDRSA